MEKTLPLYLGSSVIGSVVCRDECPYIHFTAKTFAQISGICRAYVKSSAATLLIGVLAPEGAAFTAKKTVTKNALHAAGLTLEEISFACAEEANENAAQNSAVWQKLSQIPPAFLQDGAVAALARATDAFFDHATAPTALAVPLITSRPFPRPDLLCLLTPINIDGVLCGALRVSSSGKPKRYQPARTS